MYQASLVEWKPLENWVGYANVLDGLGEVYLAQGLLEQAIKTFEDALQNLTKVPEHHLTEHLQQEITEHLQVANRQLGLDIDSSRAKLPSCR